MSLDLDFDAGQQAIASAVAGFCAERCRDETVKASAREFPRDLWRELAELGVFGLGTPHGEGGALEIVAAVESLGRAVFPGPLVASFLATQVLPDPDCAEIAAGVRIACAGVPPLMPWAASADIFLELDFPEIGSLESDFLEIGEGQVFPCRPLGEVEPVEMLGGEPWGRVSLERGTALPLGRQGLILSRIVLAAQLGAMGTRLVEDASAHAAVRKQFGVPIGDFQAVAHPLADCSMQLAAAATLARAAAFHFDAGRLDEARVDAASAQLSACRAAVDAAHVCHQVFGAIGITLEGPVFHISRQIRLLASQPPTGESARAELLACSEVAAPLRRRAATPEEGREEGRRE
jgi:alkylation response protein AidB-like acyl-CoA dehydrogenase